jgi:nanoRNase/pAp phosphatase (c-di-AMP/oligoRNAs hydrolase)
MWRLEGAGLIDRVLRVLFLIDADRPTQDHQQIRRGQVDLREIARGNLNIVDTFEDLLEGGQRTAAGLELFVGSAEINQRMAQLLNNLRSPIRQRVLSMQRGAASRWRQRP